MDLLAEDASAIAARMKEIHDEVESYYRNVSGADLDRVGQMHCIDREAGEGDLTYRNRINASRSNRG